MYNCVTYNLDIEEDLENAVRAIKDTAEDVEALVSCVYIYCISMCSAELL